MYDATGHRQLPRRNRWIRWAPTALMVAGAACLLPLRYPSLVGTYARVTCAQEWVLVKGQDGQLTGNTFNFRTGLSEGYRVSNFDRGSAVHFSLRPSVLPGQSVSRGDTVGSIYSSETQERLISLRGQLAEAQSQLAVNSTGAKPAVVYEAEQRLVFARRKLEEQEKSFARAETLYAKGLLPQAQYEAAENALHSASDDVALASAELEQDQTGAKPEQITLIHANIAALEDEIAAIERRADTYTITAPLSGRVARRFSPDTLLTISDTTQYVALIPIRWTDLARVTMVPQARVTLRGMSVPVYGTVVAVDREVAVLRGEKVVLATAVLTNPPADLIPGLTARCDITCQPMSGFALVKQFLLSLVA